ncbi:calmodulin 2-like [Planoprotostelium fungivorum]|uniref:Calmodulin 2-like n=1 Tax=Planoprotostelium fungivorum TaxID=1890364 RepID=A0A2P6NPR3_9EUKA|nr:calmodulin 2-like [Planoprotostelium fungivorum]
MKVAILFAIVFCLAVHADISEDFPQPPYNIVSSWTNGTITSLTCPDDCGNPDSKHCLWNADIQATCSATFAEKRGVEEKRQTRCQRLGYCGPVCFSDGQGGYACGCVSCGKNHPTRGSMPAVSQLIFNKYDKDKSAEFRDLCYESGKYLNDQELTAAISIIDHSGNGQIDYKEFSKWWTSYSRWGRIELTPEQQETLSSCSKYFMYFDKDRSGHLSREEFKSLHADLSRYYPGRLGATLEEALRRLDSNGDNSIQFGEYLDWLQSENIISLQN